MFWNKKYPVIIQARQKQVVICILLNEKKKLKPLISYYKTKPVKRDTKIVFNLNKMRCLD